MRLKQTTSQLGRGCSCTRVSVSWRALQSGLFTSGRELRLHRTVIERLNKQDRYDALRRALVATSLLRMEIPLMRFQPLLRRHRS